MRSVPAAALLAAILSTCAAADWSGAWETTYGMLFLSQDGDRVTGHYDISGYSSVEGTVTDDGRLVFTYREPAASGEGWFEMGPDSMSFAGEWSEDGSGTWYDWEGFRAGAGVAPSRWLVILEAEWQTNLSEREYSFGEMLDSWFARVEGVTVRHRFIHDEEDLERFLMESAGLTGEVYLLLASHGTGDGLELPGGTVDAGELIHALEPVRNLALLHFSSCEIMAGETPGEVLASRDDWPEGFVVSGYTRSVDWGASAVLEVFYLNQMLENGFPPEDAARSVEDCITFAGTDDTQWMEGAGFTWMAPGRVIRIR